MRVLSRFRWRAGLCLLLGAGSLSAQNLTYEAVAKFDNPWLLLPLAGERENARSSAIFGGHVGPYRVPRSVKPAVIPATLSGRYVLAYSALGQSVASPKPDFLLGQPMDPIIGADLSKPPGISPAAGAFYIPSKQQVITAQSGPVRVDWIMQDGTTNARVYLVSVVAFKRPVRVYWTEPPWNAPAINLRGRHAAVHYTTANPAPTVDPATNDVSAIWIDDQAMLRTKKSGSMVLLEFFETGSRTKHVGYEIVEPLEPRINTLAVTIGSRLLPVSTYYGEHGLIPDVRKGLPDYVYHHTPQNDAGHFAGWVYAIRRTVETPWNVEVYWKHKGLLEVEWPFEVDWYAADWPEDWASQLYVRGDAVTNATVTFPDSLRVELEPYQDPPKHAVLSDDHKSFHTTGPGRALLRYSSKEDVWFEVVRSVDSTNNLFFNRSVVPWSIGQELRPVELPKTAAFDGATSYLAVPGGLSASAGMTVEVWLKPWRTNLMNVFYFTDGASYYSTWHELNLSTNGVLWHRAYAGEAFGGNGPGYYGQVSSTHVTPNRWCHVALVRETPGALRLYVNGVQEGGEVSLGSTETPRSVFLFGRRHPQLDFDFFQGEMREIRVWNRALSAEEISDNLHRPLQGSEVGLARYIDFQDRCQTADGKRSYLLDLASGGSAEWVGSMVSPAMQPMRLPSYAGFDGRSSYFTVPSEPLAVTVEAWVMPLRATNVTVFALLNPATGQNRQQALSLDNQGRFRHRALSGGTKEVTGTTVARPLLWYHVAAVLKSPGKLRLYVNGLQEGPEADVGTIAPSGLVYAFGYPSGPDGDGFFEGEMREVRMWSRALTGAEIDNNMRREIAPGESGLIHHFTLEEMHLLPDGSLWLRDRVFDQTAAWRGAVGPSDYDVEPLPWYDQMLGYIREAPGRCYNPHFYTWPQTNSHIFAVNTNLLEVWWHRTSRQPYMPDGVSWPSLAVRYTNVWPLVSPQLVIAGQNWDKTGLLPNICKDPRLYYQNEPTLPGFNPNEEHALLLAGQVYALRDDLNTTNTSRPYVLVEYEDLSDAGRPKMVVFQVVETNAVYRFAQEITAGTLVQPPMPMTVLPKCDRSWLEVGPAWRDRKLDFWSYAAGPEGSPSNPAPTNTVLRFYYPVQQGFYFPGAPEQPAVGTEVPWLSRQGQGGDPIRYVYTNVWPAEVPVMLLGETLVKPKHGLPAVAGQKSVKILYQQAVVLGGEPSVLLLDPTQDRAADLAALPADVATDNRAGKIYFTQLPPHLRSRLFYEPNSHQLKLRGQFIEPPAGEYYLLLNFLGGDANVAGSDRHVVRNLSTDLAWKAAVDNLATGIVEIPEDNVPFDSLALSAAFGKTTGYVTLAFNSSESFCEPSDAVSLAIIRVEPPLYRGEVKAIFSENPLDEKLTMRHSADFGGYPERYEFDWRYLPPDGQGMPDPRPRSEWLSFTGGPTPDQLSIVIGGPGLLTLSDNYFVVRYRPLDHTGPTAEAWSDWTEPMLAEGWIKRALNGINPFEQRIKDLERARVNTTVSMISQAGPRWVGDVPLNLDNINDYGLIEIYETILRRGRMLSINAGFSYNPANDALLLAGGRLHDLYMMLGNEAYADAGDPTIAFGTRDRLLYGSEAASIFCFMNQVPTLLEEELALLRGRDDTLAPSVHTYPIYNRLIWNFTKGLDGGEPAYAMNYNIPNEDGDLSGTINEADAKKLYPQGHGDAWGHYLSAIKGYYCLLANSNFTWTPRIEAKVVGGVTVNVDYYDERKFAEAAAARARTGAEIIGLVHRRDYSEARRGIWPGFRDSNTNRAWGVSEWASRAGLGAYFDWAVGNSLLPDRDPDPTHTGIQKVDRTTVPELQEITTCLAAIQLKADHADRGLSPLGLAQDAVPFDISPADIDAGKTHFEQVYERALQAVNNAFEVLKHAQLCTQVLRRQADSQQEFTTALARSEQDYNNRLIELFGYPYPDDIGPGKLYPQGYDGPDLYHYQYVDVYDIIGGGLKQSQVIISNLVDYTRHTSDTHDWDKYSLHNVARTNVTFNILEPGFPAKPSSYRGTRRAQGEVQAAYGDYLKAWYELRSSLAAAQALQRTIGSYFYRLNDRMERFDDEDKLRRWTGISIIAAEAAVQIANFGVSYIEWNRQVTLLTCDAVAWGLPMVTVIGTSTGGDLASPARAATLDAKVIAAGVSGTAQKIWIGLKDAAAIASKAIEAYRDTQLRLYATEAIEKQLVLELDEKISQQNGKMLEIQKNLQALIQTRERFYALVAKGERLLDERTTVRARAATLVQSQRYSDLAFRLFRSEALGKYQAAFDLAARYVHLAAKAYDYETGLLRTDGQTGLESQFLASIARSRSLGRIQDGKPQLAGGFGDPGLADVMARMKANWDVLKGRFSFNNPAAETSRFSLRAELFRIATPMDPAELARSDETWRHLLWSCKVDNLLELPEFRRYCLPFNPVAATEPGLVIPFSTTIESKKNFFGWPMVGGDNAYDSSHFTTKIRSVGVWFSNFNNAFGQGLANQPRVYLIPIGSDVLRSPRDDTGTPLMFKVVDQALPIPFNVADDGLLDAPDWIPLLDSLSGGFGAMRKYPSLRAYHDRGQFDPAELSTNARLVGRSVWNTQWLLIIPASTLHGDTTRALEWFVNGVNGDGNGVKDIKLFFHTYSYSGN